MAGEVGSGKARLGKAGHGIARHSRNRRKKGKI